MFGIVIHFKNSWHSNVTLVGGAPNLQLAQALNIRMSAVTISPGQLRVQAFKYAVSCIFACLLESLIPPHPSLSLSFQDVLGISTPSPSCLLRLDRKIEKEPGCIRVKRSSYLAIVLHPIFTWWPSNFAQEAVQAGHESDRPSPTAALVSGMVLAFSAAG